MENKQLEQACAATRDLEDQSPAASQDCSDVIHISIFFDGTGNNKDVDEGSKRWSNPARIWRAADLRTKHGLPYYPIYISGVGTPFNGEPLFPGDKHLIKLQDMGATGGAFGTGGTRRLDLGRQQINDALRKALLQRAKALGGEIERHANTAKGQSFNDINRSLKKHRLIKQINVSIFGFSRGAALARAFCNQWIWQCEDNRGQLLYEEHPIRFVFLGIFDTVASFGLPATNMANTLQYGGFKGRDLVVDDRVERCVHYVAAHELRFAFPVDLIRKDGKLPSRWLEKSYPGVHSDVGGGYEPFDQEIDNNYARIPMRDMMNEALAKGVRILRYEDIATNNSQIFEERFECKPATEAAYQAYMAACNTKGAIEHCIREHMKQLYSAYGTLKRQGGESVTKRQHRLGKSWIGGPEDMATELETYERLVRNLKDPAKVLQSGVGYLISQGTYAMWLKPQDWQMKAWHATATKGVMDFIHHYVHDSKVGFMSNAEPFSYFSQRGVSESSRSVYGWLEYNVGRPVDHAVESTVDYASEKAQQAKKAATEAAQKAQKAATHTAEKVQSTARHAVDYASEKGKQALDMATNTAKQTQQAVSSAASQAANTASKATKAVGDATQSALKQLEGAWKELGW